MSGSETLPLTRNTIDTAGRVVESTVQSLLSKCHELLEAGSKNNLKALHLARQACLLRPADRACHLQAARALQACGHSKRASKALEKAKSCADGGGEAATEPAKGQRESEQGCSLLRLSDDVIVEVLAYLTLADVARVQRTSKRLEALTRAHCELWRNVSPMAFDDISREVVDGFKNIARRADGQLHTLELWISKKRSQALYSTELAIELLQNVPAQDLRKLSIYLFMTPAGMSPDPRIVAEVDRICRDEVKLEVVSLNIESLMCIRGFWSSTKCPVLAPPLTSLTLDSQCGQSTVINSLNRFRETLQTFKCSSFDWNEHEDGDDSMEIMLPKLVSLIIAGDCMPQKDQPMAVKLRMPILKKLVWKSCNLKLSSIGQHFKPHIEALDMSFHGEDEEALCAALPSMTRLGRLNLDGFASEKVLRVLADNPFIPLKILYIVLGEQNSGAELVRLVAVRLHGQVRIEKLYVSDCPDLLPEHATWLRENVETVEMDKYDW